MIPRRLISYERARIEGDPLNKKENGNGMNGNKTTSRDGTLDRDRYIKDIMDR